MHKRGIFALLLIALLSAAAFSLTDEDGDTYCLFADTGCPSGIDCNDNNPEVNPGAEEVPGDGIDNDCNGIVDDACTDADNDGYNKEADAGGVDCGGEENVDCDDASIYINPGAEEICDDGIDNDCSGLADDEDPACTVGEGETSGCTLHAEMSVWVNCDAEEINSANEGDTVYMVLWAEGCDEDSDVAFKIYEHSPGDETYEDTVAAVETLTDVPDEAGNPTDVDIWFAPWVASYIEDDDGTEPEYYFRAELAEPGFGTKFLESGKTEDTLLSVTGCDNCGIECVLDVGGIAGMDGGGIAARYPECLAEVDCTSAPWSSCNPSTGKMTRDTELCEVSGTGTVECMENAKAMLADEKLCSSSSSPSSKSTRGPELFECGDGICDEGEDCDEDCGVPGKGFPWLWVLLVVIAVGAVTSGVIYAYKKKKGAVKKPGEKTMPFSQQKDLDSVLGYIKAARAKGYNDAQVAEALKKAGWNDEQVKFAFEKMKAGKPAEQKPK